ncbi:MAG: hypothetical protein AAFQ07_08625 [Chloroflexota bacterium]
MRPFAEDTLVKQAHNRAVAITTDDMLHITWKHVTLHLNVTGMVYLVRYLNNTLLPEDATNHFTLYGNPDDGYELWIQDVGLRLSPEDTVCFKDLLSDALLALKQRKNGALVQTFGGALLFTREWQATDQDEFSGN